MLAIAVAGTLSVTGPPGAVRAQSEAPQAVVACKSPEWDRIRALVPAGARIELLVAAGNTIPRKRWQSYKEAAIAVLACAGEGAAIELLPITDNGVNVAPLFVSVAPTPNPDANNPLRRRLEKAQFVKTGLAAIESLHTTTEVYNGFDPLGALQLAGESLHSTPSGGKMVVIVIGNGWQQTPRINLFRWQHNPSTHAQEVIEKLKADGTLPNLAATDVIIAGLDLGDRGMRMSGTDMTGLCAFWDRIVRAGNGKLQWCKAALPGMVMPLQSQ